MSGPTRKETECPSLPMGIIAGDEYPGEYYFVDDLHRVLNCDAFASKIIVVFNIVHHRKYGKNNMSESEFVRRLLSVI